MSQRDFAADKRQAERQLANELKREIMMARGTIESTAKLIPAVLFLLDRFIADER
jgi:hypothetical protein